LEVEPPQHGDDGGEGARSTARRQRTAPVHTHFASSMLLSVRLGYGATALLFTLAKVVSNDSRFQGFLSMLFKSLIVSVGV
jgi:hypothetical protein